MLDFWGDALLAPFRAVWEIFPPAVAAVLTIIMVLMIAAFATDWEQTLDEVRDESNAMLGGYHPDVGYKFDPEDFD